MKNIEKFKGGLKASQLNAKNVVNMYDGVRMCSINRVNFTFDTQTGEIKMLLLPSRSVFKNRKMIQVPWDCIRKIGREVIIVDMGCSK